MGMTVLKTLAAMGGAASLSALSARLKESPAKLHRYLASLVAADLVVQESTSARYALGSAAIAIGLAAMRRSDVLTVTAPALLELAEVHGLSSFVAVLGNHGPTIVRWEEPMQTVTVNVRVGSVLPVLWSATGRAFGAFCESRTMEPFIATELAALTPEHRRLIPNRAAVDKLFKRIRTSRCAPVSDVLLKGVSAVGAPVFDADGKVVAVITSLGPTGGFDPSPSGAIATALRRCSDAASARLGHDAAP
jgi:DNA-binding IclR family transcriptional regulator